MGGAGPDESADADWAVHDCAASPWTDEFSNPWVVARDARGAPGDVLARAARHDQEGPGFDFWIRKIADRFGGQVVAWPVDDVFWVDVIALGNAIQPFSGRPFVVGAVHRQDV